MEHTIQEDFEHFLSYSGNQGVSGDDRTKLFEAFEAGYPNEDEKIRIKNAEKLAGLVLTLFNTVTYKEMQAGPIREEVERLAHLLAPAAVARPETVLYTGVVSAESLSWGSTPSIISRTYELRDSAAQTGEPGTGRFEPVEDERDFECPYCGAQLLLPATERIPAHKTPLIGALCAAGKMALNDAIYRAQFLPTLDATFCTCNLPGLDAGDPTVCPTCKRPHRI